ncbi:MAG TPA: protein kinase [Geothrix sp.]
MHRPLLLVVDAESLRTPSLVSALEGDGWALRWIQASEAPALLDSGLQPHLLLLDSTTPEEAGYVLAGALQARQPGLPVLVLSDGSHPGLGEQAGKVDIQAFLDRTEPYEFLVAKLRSFQPEEVKLTTDNIFGDLLEDLERIPPPPDDPFALHLDDAVAARPARFQPPLGAAHLIDQLHEQEEAEPVATPERSDLPVPAVTMVAARIPAKVPASQTPEPVRSEMPLAADLAEPLGPSDFTLSGISGVKDPFEWAAPAAPASPWAEVEAPRPAVPQATDAIEEYGNYFLLEKIAVGGMAELFKAQQRGVQGFQKIVAIKRILPHFSDNEDFVTMFIDEAKLAAQLTHPNIVQIFDLGKAGSSYYIAMEYVNGRDLRTLLRKVREYRMPFPEQVAAFVVMRVAAALDYAHRKRGFDDKELKLVHRDISPQNVILSTEGSVKLVDFGIAKAASKASHTVAGALKGKLLYMSPEQATGQPLDNRSDLYSLGLVLFELLTGERCFQADSELGVLEKVRLGRISDLASLNPTVSRDMAAIVNKALQKGVDHRYPSARFMERDLRDYLQRQGNPLTEHDVAEYMNTLLGGTREQLQALVTARFPVPTSLTSGSDRPLGELTVALPARPAAPSRAVSREESPLEPMPAVAAPLRPRWLLPVILALAVMLVIMLAVARWS